MKKTFITLTISFLLAATAVSAQTNNTEKVKSRFPLTYNNIIVNAEKKWENDYDMQKYVIDKQCNAVIDYLYLNEKHNLPDDVFYTICGEALDKWSKGKLKECNEGGTFDEMASCLNVDWEMINYTVEKQCVAYKELHP